MSNDGKQLYEAVRQARGLIVEIARMLSDCDRLMSECDWLSPSTASVSGSSASINNPGHWIPHALNRIYTNKNDPKVSKVIAVILEDEWTNRLDELVVVGSSYQTVEDQFVGFFGWDHTWWWLKITDAIADGKKKTITSSSLDTAEFNKAFGRFNEIELCGFPMAELTDSDSIKSHVVDPLIGK